MPPILHDIQSMHNTDFGLYINLHDDPAAFGGTLKFTVRATLYRYNRHGDLNEYGQPYVTQFICSSEMLMHNPNDASAQFIEHLVGTIPANHREATLVSMLFRYWHPRIVTRARQVIQNVPEGFHVFTDVRLFYWTWMGRVARKHAGSITLSPQGYVRMSNLMGNPPPRFEIVWFHFVEGQNNVAHDDDDEDDEEDEEVDQQVIDYEAEVDRRICWICGRIFRPHASAVRLHCGHLFHGSCLADHCMNWMGRYPAATRALCTCCAKPI